MVEVEEIVVGLLEVRYSASLSSLRPNIREELQFSGGEEEEEHSDNVEEDVVGGGGEPFKFVARISCKERMDLTESVLSNCCKTFLSRLMETRFLEADEGVVGVVGNDEDEEEEDDEHDDTPFRFDFVINSKK